MHVCARARVCTHVCLSKESKNHLGLEKVFMKNFFDEFKDCKEWLCDDAEISEQEEKEIAQLFSSVHTENDDDDNCEMLLKNFKVGRLDDGILLEPNNCTGDFLPYEAKEIATQEYLREKDETYQKQFYACCKYLLTQESASCARLQKECCDGNYLRVGYIIDRMKQEGVIDIFQKVDKEKMKLLVEQLEKGKVVD